MHQHTGEDGTLAAVLSGCDAAIVATDRERRVRVWNEAAADLFGWQPAEIRGEVCPLTPTAGESLDDAVERALDGECVAAVPAVVPDRDGIEHRLDVTVTPLCPDGTDPDGVVTTFTETTRERTLQLERRIDHLESFADTVAHDLRGPLNAATSSVTLARDSDCPDEHLDRAKRCLDRIEAIIDDLLALSRDGDRSPAPTDVWLSNVVEDAWLAVEEPDSHLLIDEDVCLRADRGQLRQLLANLLRNAVEHATDEVTIRTGALADRTGFYVADDGPGVPASRHDTIFEYGYTSDEDGTGYGLTIVERIADVHGWTVDVADSQYGGARFELYENFSRSEA